VKESDRRSLAEPGFDVLQYVFEVANELLVGMMRRHDRHVLPVVAEIEHQQVEVGKQVLPKGKVAVGGEAVAVREDQPNTVRAPVSPYANLRPVVERDAEDHACCGKLEKHLGRVVIRRLGAGLSAVAAKQRKAGGRCRD
jgi:hypothetical protein